MSRVAFCLADGSIRRVSENPEMAVEDFFVAEDETAREAADSSITPSSHYWSGSAFVAKTALTATWDTQAIDADGIDVATLSGLPQPCTVDVNGQSVVVEDGTFELCASSPGAYSVHVQHPQHFSARWVVYAD